MVESLVELLGFVTQEASDAHLWSCMIPELWCYQNTKTQNLDGDV